MVAVWPYFIVPVLGGFKAKKSPTLTTRTATYQTRNCFSFSHLYALLTRQCTHPVGHTDSPGDRSSPWSSAGRSPCLCASVLQKADVEIRPSRAGGNCTGASGGSSVCNLFVGSVHKVITSVQWEQMLSLILGLHHLHFL